MIPNPKEKQSFLQTSGQDAGTQCLSRTRSVFRGHTVPLAPTADVRRLFAPTAGTLCLSRLRRTHGVFSRLRRTHGVFSRLRRAHSAFRAYGGHTVPLAPTASPKEANCEEFAFRSTGEALQKQGTNFLKTGSHRSASDLKEKSIE